MREGHQGIDYVFITRHLSDIIPNPWVAYGIVEQALTALHSKYKDVRLIENNIVFIIEELRKKAVAERDRLAEAVFKKLVQDKKIRFILVKDEVGWRMGFVA